MKKDYEISLTMKIRSPLNSFSLSVRPTLHRTVSLDIDKFDDEECVDLKAVQMKIQLSYVGII